MQYHCTSHRRCKFVCSVAIEINTGAHAGKKQSTVCCHLRYELALILRIMCSPLSGFARADIERIMRIPKTCRKYKMININANIQDSKFAPIREGTKQFPGLLKKLFKMFVQV